MALCWPRRLCHVHARRLSGSWSTTSCHPAAASTAIALKDVPNGDRWSASPIVRGWCLPRLVCFLLKNNSPLGQIPGRRSPLRDPCSIGAAVYTNESLCEWHPGNNTVPNAYRSPTWLPCWLRQQAPYSKVELHATNEPSSISLPSIW